MIKGKPKLLNLRFRFTAPADVEAWGEGWHTYDESAILAKPAKELMRWEGEIGLPLADVMNGVREDSVTGDTCAAWLALKLGGSEVKFSEFSPAIMLAEWEVAPKAEDLGKAPTPAPVSAPGSDSEPIVLSEVILGS